MMASDTRRWKATTHGLRSVFTVIPPTTACAGMPSNRTMPIRSRSLAPAARSPRRASRPRSRSARTSACGSRTRSPSGSRARRAACTTPRCTAARSGSRGPEPVRRTAPPVSTMPMLATRVAQASGRSQRAHSHENVLDAATDPSTAQPASTASSRQAIRPSQQGVAHRLAERPRGQPGGDVAEPAVRRGRQDHRATGEQEQVDEVGHGQRGLGAQRARDQQAKRGERGGAECTASTAPTTPTAPGEGDQPEDQADRTDHDDLEDLDEQQGQDLAGQQPATRER